MTAITAPTTKISADQAKGSVLRNVQLAEAMTLGTDLAVALDSSGKLVKADANDSSKARAIGILVAGSNLYGETSLPAGSYGTVCVFGPVYGFSSLAEGTYVWVSETAGELDDTAPSSAAYQHIVAQCMSTGILHVMPGISTPTSV